jgi:hypothetical protein
MGFWDVMKEMGEYGYVPAGLLYRWFGPEPYFPSPRPESIDFLQSKIGTPLPLVYGTIRVDNGVLYWHGNQSAIPDATGFIYNVDMLLGVGVPSWDEAAAPYNNWRATSPPKLLRFWYGDQPSFAGVPTNLEHGEGGFVGVSHSGNDDFFNRVQFFDGRPTQLLTDGDDVIRGALLLAGADEDLIPGYRHQMLVGIVMGSGTSGIGHSPHVASIGLEIESLGPQPIASPNGNGSFDANPAWVLYDLLCGKVWKIGFDPSRVDLASFQLAADTLEAEGHGISLVVYQSEPAIRVLGAICSQINGLVFEDPSTGKLKLKLIRKNYLDDHSGLRRMTKDNTVGRPKVTMVGAQDTKNHVTLHFTNRDREYHPDVVIDQRLATAVGQNNRIRPVEADMPGITNNVTAALTASRELAVVSRPLITATATLNREFYETLPGDVLVADWPDLQVEDVPMRVFNVGLGQRAKGEIRVVLIEDVFDHGGAGFTPPVDDTALLNVIPLTERVFDEAPFYLINELRAAGAVPNTDQRLFSLAVMEGIANRHRNDTTNGFSADEPNFAISTPTADVPADFANATAKVSTLYPKTAGPYDTVTGLVVNAVSANFVSEVIDSQATVVDIDSEIRNTQRNLILVVPAGSTTGGEFMAFESVTDLGGGSYRLNRVWRELMDTRSQDHAVGARVYWVDLNSLGRRAWAEDFWVRGNDIPMRIALEETICYPDEIRVALRGLRPLRLADFSVVGYEATGTVGVPVVDAPGALGNYLKEVTDLDGALDVSGRERHPAQPEIARGSDAVTGWLSATGTTYDLYGQKDAEPEVMITEDLPNLFDPTDSMAAPLAAGVLLGKAGHGALDLIAHTVNTAGDRSWQSPRVRVAAHRYRNLLANGSFEYAALLPGWSAVNVGVQTGASSLSRSATGRWAQATADAGTLVQTVEVHGYKAKGLSALVTLYIKTIADELAGVTVTIAELDANDSVLSTSSSALLKSDSTTAWTRKTFEKTITNVDTVKVRVTLTFGKSTDAATRLFLQLGQYTAQLLLNPSFDGNSTANWSAAGAPYDSNAPASTSIPYANDGGTAGACLAGLGAAKTGIRQDVAMSAGYEYGTAVVEYAQAHRSAGGANADTLTAVVYALNGGGSVITSASSGAIAHNTVPDVWFRHRVALDLPDGTVTVRVEFLHDRIDGAATMVDDVSLRIHKHLDASSTVDFDFGAPARALAPNSWQAFHLAYSALAIPVVWGGTSSAESAQASKTKTLSRRGWSDGSADSARRGTMRGHFEIFDGVANDDLDCYVFNGALPIVVSGGITDTNYAKFTAADSFTVAVLMRSTDLAWSTACGLVGRRNSSDIGWEIQLTADGKARVVFKGASSEVSATSSDVVCDRSPRWVFMRCDGTNMKVYTKAGNAGTALAGLGDTSVTFTDFGIGRGAASSNVFRGQIARVLLWDSALAEADIAAMVAEIGADPSGLLTTWTSDQPVWVPNTVSGEDRLVRCAATDVPIAHSSVLDADGDGYGLALTRGNTNRVVTNDVTDTTKWGPEAGSFILNRATPDATGLPRGISVGQQTANAGFRVTDMPAPLDAYLWTTIVYLKAVTSSLTVNVELLDSNGVSKGTVPCVATTVWKRFVVQHDWDGATPTAHLRFVIAGGATGTYMITHALWSGFVVGTNQQGAYPIAIQDANTTIADTNAVRSASLSQQLIHEGEIYVEGTMNPHPSFGTGGPFGLVFTDSYAIASVEDDGTNINKRTLDLDTAISAASSDFHSSLYNAAGTLQSGDGVVGSQDVRTAWRARARWNTLSIPDGGAVQRGCAVEIDGATSAHYLANAFTVNATTHDKIRIGGDGASRMTPMAIVRRVKVQARETKLLGG